MTRNRGQEAPRGTAGEGVSRRVVLRAAGGAVLVAVLPACGGAGGRSGIGESAEMASDAGGYLDAHELQTLRAFVERVIPEDTDPGALSGCCAEAIDQLLAAFQTDPPRIYAGAPFSDRGGYPVNRFEQFLPLDAYEELAWRLTIEGSNGLPEREFNGPVKGLQVIYRDGLARLDERAAELGFADFASAPAPVRDQIIGDTGDERIAELVDVGYLHTLDAMYGPPEYGGNCDLAGWTFTSFDGDVQPRGYSVQQVVNADNPGAFDALLPPSYHSGEGGSGGRTGPVAHTASRAGGLALAPATDAVAAAMMASGGRWSALRAALMPKSDDHA